MAEVFSKGLFKTLFYRNLKPIKAIIELCHQIERLDCLVYVSTIATVIGSGYKSEVVPTNAAVNIDFIIESCDNLNDKDLKEMTKSLFKNYLNTYCVSKALCEQALLEESDKFNIAIIRPSAILPACKEPVSGWVQGKQVNITPMLIGLGITQAMPPLSGNTQCFIPVDFVANSIIASVCTVANQK